MKYKMLNKCVYNASQKHNDSRSINKMHNFKVKAGWPVGIFFPEEIHNSKILKAGYRF
jgi:hypothetical protein